MGLAYFEEVKNSDVIFWLMQHAPTVQSMPCTVYYDFDKPLDEALLRSRLTELIGKYTMFHRNVVEYDGLPYWQPVQLDWDQNFRVLKADEDIEKIRYAFDTEMSQPYNPGEGIPLFRAYLSSDGRQFTFLWHHVISDIEGMFNKHAQHLFGVDGERTKSEYSQENVGQKFSLDLTSFVNWIKKFSSKPKNTVPLVICDKEFSAQEFILPANDNELDAMSRAANLGLSDIFAFIALRTVTYYHSKIGKDDPMGEDIIMRSPRSSRQNSLKMDEGNNRVIKGLPLVFPIESVETMYNRLLVTPDTSGSYDIGGYIRKKINNMPTMIKKLDSKMPEYVSNYTPLSEDPMSIGKSTVLNYRLRVPMTTNEHCKFVWINYNDVTKLSLELYPSVVQKDVMVSSYQQASKEVLELLRSKSSIKA